MHEMLLLTKKRRLKMNKKYLVTVMHPFAMIAVQLGGLAESCEAEVKGDRSIQTSI